MKVKDQIIEVLEKNRGIYISGEELAREIGVSRTAVWKNIKKLQEEGFLIDGVNNKGYMLKLDTDVLLKSGIEAKLNSGVNANIEVFKTIDSTNIYLKAHSDKPDRTVVVAEHQTNGYGRLGRNFYSPKDTGVYFSILLKPQMSNDDLVLLTSLAGVCVCEAIEKYTDKEPKIKWVNDIFIGDKKVCGILTQGAFDMETMTTEYLVIGIGIDVYPPNDGYANDLQSIAGSVLDERIGNMKNSLVAEVLNRFFYYYEHYSEKEFIEEYKKRCFVVGRNVKVVKPNETIEAFAEGVDDQCRLLVRYKDGSRDALSTGEISIRF